MKCNNCSKEFIRPLQLSNGGFACPKCLKNLSKIYYDKFIINKENDEHFKLSEIYFHKSLVEPSKVEYKEAAIDYCQAAADLFHPEAIMRLGYYYHFGFISGQSDEYNHSLAEKYYSAIINGPNIILPNNDVNKLADIKERTNKFLDLLNTKSDDLDNDIYKDSARLNDFIKLHISKFRKPIFSYIRVNQEDIKSLKNNYKLLEKITIGVFAYDNGKLSDKSLRILNSDSFSNDKLNNDQYYLFVINNINNFKRNNLIGPKAKLKKFLKIINPIKISKEDMDRYELINEIIDNYINDGFVEMCCFYEDDLIYKKYDINNFIGYDEE